MSYVDIIIPFVGGLALFIYGMQIMAQGLQNAAGSKMKQLLKALTQNKVMGVLLGAVVTAIIQSSSATTVMVVGFVNAGLMDLTQSMSVIMGANIGTTVTGWLVSSVEWAKFLSPAVIAPVVLMAGVVIMITAKKVSHKEISSIIIGFGVLFIGIEMMSDAVYPLRESEVFKTLFITLGDNPLLGILAGATVTAIIQSSSASVGILQTLAASGLVPFDALLFPFSGYIIALAKKINHASVQEEQDESELVHLDDRLLETPSFAVQSAVLEVVRMGYIVEKNSSKGSFYACSN